MDPNPNRCTVEVVPHIPVGAGSSKGPTLDRGRARRLYLEKSHCPCAKSGRCIGSEVSLAMGPRSFNILVIYMFHTVIWFALSFSVLLSFASFKPPTICSVLLISLARSGSGSLTKLMFSHGVVRIPVSSSWDES